MPLEQAYAYATQNMIEVMGNEDAVEGSRAFFEKREPRWKGD
jgi:enoyl-CoA hydratase/carnithine racemase